MTENLNDKEISLSINDKEIFNRSTLEVAKSIIDGDKIATRSKKFLKEENRLGFLSVWSAFNAAFSVIVDLHDSDDTPIEIKAKLEAVYKGIPVGFNLPLETRIPPEIRAMRMSQADDTRAKSGSDKIIVKGYNDPESLEEWARIKAEREADNKPSLM